MPIFPTSCAKKKDNFNNPYYIKASNLYKEGKYDQAIIFYKKYLLLFPKSAKANYYLASVYQEKEDYINAIHYFKKYLNLDPNSTDKGVIKKWIISSQESLYKKLQKEYSEPNNEIRTQVKNNLETEKQLEELREKNKQMKDFILKHKDKILESDHPSQETSFSNSSLKTSSKHRYIVKEGDSLYKISNKLYGSGKYYKLIWDANKSRYRAPSNLHPGDILIIPSLPSSNQQKKLQKQHAQ